MDIAVYRKVMDTVDKISKVISNGCWRDGCFVIYDTPYTIEIGKDRIVLKESGDEVVILTREGIAYARSEEELKYLEEWCVALTKMSFKRFIPKKFS